MIENQLLHFAEQVMSALTLKSVLVMSTQALALTQSS
jgi:hypothetical protein